MKRITITVDEVMYKRVQRIVAERLLHGESASFASVVREALEHYVKSISGESMKSIISEDVKITTSESMKREKTVSGISQTVSGIPKRKVAGPSESIERPSEVEEIPPEEVLSTEESSEKYERVEDEIVEEFLEGRGEPTIGDKIVSILYERAREPKELMKMLIDMGYPPEECEKVLEELVKKGAIEVCEVQIGKYGKKTLLRLKGSK